ncbi:MAG: 4-hydroxy-tetrahydrodipicolinate synthase [Planctomycetota bacterium]|jgi:4-hydroxy-tetrahydrodipicolinate synthase|nr:4-hydroxy-tetrahydrodipicolinate synthase [Planctomycetota bacterium]MDP6761962.1 4-hydroxy-tetrahydrodipicolinate synthase [Planctomycetota bacterium]MDP6990732.1 4-hydroxy-tetrahydrodipicolinate synthase [Planctomycetota bacterium]
MYGHFQGSIVALPTPFRDGHLDLDAFEELIDHHVEQRTDGLVVAGTTGEAPTLNDYEQRSLIHAAVDHAAGRLPVVAGVGSNCTRSTVDLARFAAAEGADGVLVVTPYYNRPSRQGLIGHFSQVADATDAAVVLYNVPSRTAVDLEPDVVAELARHHENIVAVKESGSSVQRVEELVACAPVAVLCGEDSCIAPFAAAGAVGAVSVVGNLAPAEVSELVRAARPDGDAARAAELQSWLAPLVRDLYIEVNPVPVKAALAQLGRCRAEVRSPLAPLEESSRVRLHATLARYTADQPVPVP